MSEADAWGFEEEAGDPPEPWVDEPAADPAAEQRRVEAIRELEEMKSQLDQKSAAFQAKVVPLVDDLEKKAILARADAEIPGKARIIRPPLLAELEVQPRDPLFVLRSDYGATVLAERDYGMLFAKRGAGKTQWSTGSGLALSGGGNHAHMKAVAPRRVLYVEGEMSVVDMKKRIAAFLRAMPKEERAAAEENFFLLSWELNGDSGLPSLAGPEGWGYLDEAIERVDPALVIVDNISCLAGGAVENAEEAWAPIGEWAARHRKERSWWWVHHESRSGTARGTSKREDPMDFVLWLKQPQGYTPKDGACFEVNWTKARGRRGEVVEPRTFRLDSFGEGDAETFVWNEVDREETTTKALASKLERCFPIAKAILDMDPSLSQRAARPAIRERFREEYGEGVSDSIINQAYDRAISE